MELWLRNFISHALIENTPGWSSPLH